MEIAELNFPRPSITRQEWHYTVKQVLEQAKESGQTMGAFRKLGESSLFFFAVYILHMDYLDNDWGYALCHEVSEHKYGRQWILSREHFKSTVITIASTIREIVMEPESTIAIYSYSQDIAQKLFFNPIKKELEENYLLQSLYPEVLWKDEQPQDIWQATQLNVKRKRRSKEATLQCASIFKQLTGYHCEKLIFDDCSTLESVQTSDSIQKTCDAFDMTMSTGTGGHTKICVVGTYYTYHELYEYISKKGTLATIVQPCMDKNGVGIRFSAEELVQKRKESGSSTFATQWLCDPKQGSSIGFKDEWLKFWTPNITAGLNIYIFVDPAGKVGRKRDNSVFWVIGLDSLDNYYVIDLIADKLTLTQRADILFQLYRTYKPKRVFYEQVGLQADIEHIRDRMERLNYRFPITELHQSVEKGMRMEALIPIFEAGRVYLPEHCWHKNWQGEDEDMIQSFIIEEYKAFPHMTHDDRLDDLANIVHPQIAHQLQRPDATNEERDIYEKMNARGFVDLPFNDGDASPTDYYPI